MRLTSQKHVTVEKFVMQKGEYRNTKLFTTNKSKDFSVRKIDLLFVGDNLITKTKNKGKSKFVLSIH